jgi:hypothetical protein
MPFYEIIYEPGTKSVAYYEDDEEALSALNAIHAKAVKGEPGSPESSPHPSGEVSPFAGTWAAERPVKCFVYDGHPGDYEEEIDTSALTGNPQEMISQIRNAASPLVENPGAQESQFKAAPTKELDLSNLGTGA